MKIDLTKDEIAALRSVTRQSIILFDEAGDEFQDPVSRLLVASMKTSLAKLERASMSDRIHAVMAAGPKGN